MWKAHFAFHICIAYLLPELLRRSIVQRTVRSFAVVLPLPVRQRFLHVVQGAEPAYVEALVAQPAVEALDVSVLHRLDRLDVDQADFPLLRPSDHAPRGELRAVVRAQLLRPAALGD